MTIDTTSWTRSIVRRSRARKPLAIAATLVTAIGLLGATALQDLSAAAVPNPAIVGEWNARLEGAGEAPGRSGPSNPALVGRWGLGEGDRRDRGGSPAVVGGWTPRPTAERAIQRPAERGAVGADLAANPPVATTPAGEALAADMGATTQPRSGRPGLVLERVLYFDSAVAVPRTHVDEVLDEIGRALERTPQLTLEVAGHTDSHGSDAFNDLLSRARAQGALDLLVERYPAIDRERITMMGYGESQPAAGNGTYADRARNRRVELKVLRAQLARR